MDYLKQILLKRNNKNRKPYGHSLPPSINIIINNIDIVIDEWNLFVKDKNQIGVSIDELSTEQKHLNLDKKWKVVFLYVYGEFNKNIEPYFPQTVKMIHQSKRDIKLVFFSNLESGKHIPPHTGNNHSVLRTQIGIDIDCPEKTGLRVSDQTIHIKNKEHFTFDDTFEHEAWNDSPSRRIVLIIDTSKNFSYLYKLINHFILRKMKMTPYVQSVIEKIK